MTILDNENRFTIIELYYFRIEIYGRLTRNLI